MTLSLVSSAFRDGGHIPQKYARQGSNLSPPLAWNDPPAGTKSFALIVEDPDAPSGTFRHWAIYDIEPERMTLPEGARIDFARCGINDFGDDHYDGPQPPRGHGVHHYHFRLAALDVETLGVPTRAKVAEIWKAAKPHVLAEAELIGTFETN
jgi:Raf kinase inhibitor-like YbhB/YbcL family protein